MHFTSEQVVQFLKDNAYHVLTVEPETEDADAAVWLTSRIHVQVCSLGGLAVCLTSPPGAAFENVWVRQWDANTLDDVLKWLPAAKAALVEEEGEQPAPTWQGSIRNAGPGQKQTAGMTHLRAAARLLLSTHQTVDEDARRAALEHLRDVVALVDSQRPIDALNPIGRLE